MLSPTHLHYLATPPLARQRRWAYTDTARDTIDTLVAAGLLEPAYGEMVFSAIASESRETIRVAGVDMPLLGKLVSLYRLTAAGAALLAREAREAANDDAATG
jgi:hypothetical protein